MSIAAKIKGCQVRLVDIKDRLTLLRKTAESEECEALTDAELEELEALEEEQESVTKQLEGFQRIEDGLKANAKEAAPAHLAHTGISKELKPGELLVKMAVAHFYAHDQRKNVDQVLNEQYKDDPRVAAAVRWTMNKSVVNDATTTTPGWAAELVANDIQNFLDLLEAESVYAQVAALSTRFTFDSYGQITVPRRNNTNRLSGAWVGEGGAIPVKMGSMGSTVLTPFKMGVISTWTKELGRRSRPAIEQVVRQAMIADTAEALDAAFLSSAAAVAGVRPAGILNGVTPIASSGTDLANIIADLQAAFGPMYAVNAGTQPVLIMHPTRAMGLGLLTNATGSFVFRNEVNSGVLLGARLIISTNVPTDVIIALDASSLATAYGTPEFDVSDTATLVMNNADDTPPTMAIDAAGALGTPEEVLPEGGIDVVPKAAVAAGAGVAGYYAESLYQTWCTAIRMVLPVSYGVIRPGTIAVIDSIAW